MGSGTGQMRSVKRDMGYIYITISSGYQRDWETSLWDGRSFPLDPKFSYYAIGIEGVYVVNDTRFKIVIIVVTRSYSLC